MHVDSATLTTATRYQLDVCDSEHSGFVCKKPLSLLYQMGLPWEPDVMPVGREDRMRNEPNTRVAAFSVIDSSTLDNINMTTLSCHNMEESRCAAGCLADSNCLYFRMSCSFKNRCRRQQCRLLGRYDENHESVRCHID
ncbi:hypothetical protein NP493_522g00003 [Ridgeia piscesae]|uniref:Uncharacterized protein n=1 Tax=Ridgeia piscesae TaxID=27915 RepID=A0AAD9KXY3_RIDPI|nr:hypothetical protein NP493_522g00003 [Ridgeia piscesae]